MWLIYVGSQSVIAVNKHWLNNGATIGFGKLAKRIAEKMEGNMF